MRFDAAAAFGQLLVGIEHINHCAQIAVGETGIIDSHRRIGSRSRIVGEIVDSENILCHCGACADNQNEQRNDEYGQYSTQPFHAENPPVACRSWGGEFSEGQRCRANLLAALIFTTTHVA
jgi:hypothetical protein